MSLDHILARYRNSSLAQAISEARTSRGKNADLVQVTGAAGSLSSMAIADWASGIDGCCLCVTPEEEQAVYVHSDLHQFFGGREELLLHFPAESAVYYDPDHVEDFSRTIRRSDGLQRLRGGFHGVIVADVRALISYVAAPEAVVASTMSLHYGMQMDPERLLADLHDQGFDSVDFVKEPGELSRRGGIVDVFPFTGEYPIRIEFFGDEIDSMREFDPATQRSVSRIENCRIVPSFDRESGGEMKTATLFDYLPEGSSAVVLGGAHVFDTAAQELESASDAYHRLLKKIAEADEKRSVFEEKEPPPPPPHVLFMDTDSLHRRLLVLSSLSISTPSTLLAPDQPVIDAGTTPQPTFNGSVKLLRRQLAANKKEGISTVILCDSRGQENRLYDLLDVETNPLDVQLLVESLHEGFVWKAEGLAVYTDHQIFNRYHRPTTRKRKKKSGISLRELRDLTIGDYVVHVDYGVGIFDGMERIEVRNKQQEAVRVTYSDGDVLYVNVSALHKLHKFTGQEGHKPRLTRLGSGQWERTKSRTKKRVKEIARDLIKLYAERKSAEGYAYPADTVWQQELEASFPYEDTPDQAAATAQVKSDMEATVPMDRLVCGDVGFGKTEIAVRAAFKAVQDGKQVALLVPTTILADQHYDTFKKRLAQFPVEVDMLSRFRSREQQQITRERLKTGKVDVLVGTHRASSKDIMFNDLGLLIIDEEQRFGVRVKERLRSIRPNVDTLTLTATPIPRTLQFSLMGARDLSIIYTAPPDRRPINTEIHTYDKNLVRDAILYETSRGGQVFFVHNRVRSIDEMAFSLRQLVENVRFQVAHGQMPSRQLEKVMHDFVNHRFDVLVSTNIVESGLDVPNANTIIINRADRFGLADLHQLRGRVGRSDRKAFCYLLTPPIKSLTREARRRLRAVEEFTDLGAGFSIAMRDLDIRGAGNLLGVQQSGFIADIGFETFHRILDEAVHELQTEEFSDVFADRAEPPQLGDTSIDVEADAFIPEDYVTNRLERLSIYRRLSEIHETKELTELKDELTDRFGAVPDALNNLLQATEIKLLLQPWRLARIQFKNRRLFLEMPPKEDAFFYLHLFHPLLQILNDGGFRYALKESPRKLRVIVQDTPNLGHCLRVASHLAEARPNAPA